MKGLSAALTMATLATVVVVVEPSPEHATAGVTCKERNVVGNCTVWKGGGDNSQPLPEPEEGATWIEEKWSTNCSERYDLVPCRDRDPCEEGEEFTHVAVTQRKWVYHSPEWQVVEGWHQANPWVQCRKVAEKEITEEDVRRAVESFGMKSGKVEAAPPGGKTLVDLETIVWTEQGPYDFELEVLETNIDLIATPEAYHWEFGDGGRQRGTPLVSLTRTAFR